MGKKQQLLNLLNFNIKQVYLQKGHELDELDEFSRISIPIS
jgi:hypothetical protein